MTQPPTLGIDLRSWVEPVSTTLRPQQQSPPTPIGSLYETELAIKFRLPIGFIRPYKRIADLDKIDHEDEQRCDDVYNLFDERIGLAYHMVARQPLSGADFRQAWWEIIQEGRHPDADIQPHAVQGVALERNPPALSGPQAPTLFGFQKQDVGAAYRIMQKHLSVLLGHEMGLGKTIQSVALVEHERAEGAVTLIVVPSHLIPQWMAQLAKLVPTRRIYNYRRQSKEALTPEQIVRDFDYVVTSYTMVSREYAATTTMARHQQLRRQGQEVEIIQPTEAQLRRAIVLDLPQPKDKHVPLLKDLPKGTLHHIWFDSIICDEAHVARGNGPITESLCALLRKKTVLVTGTPQQNNYYDLFAMCRLLDISPFANDELAFRQYFVNESNKTKWLPLGHSRLRILALTLRAFSVRRIHTDLFDGKFPIDQIQVEDYDPIRPKPDDGTRYPHHISLGCGSEKYNQLSTKHLWTLFRKVETDENKTWEENLEEALNPEEAEDAKEAQGKRLIFVLIQRCRQAAAHPGILLRLPVPMEVTSEPVSRHQMKVMEDAAWISLMREGENYRSSTIDAVLDVIEEHLTDRKLHPEKRGGILVFSEFHRVLDILEIGIRKRFNIGCLRRTGKSTDAEKDYAEKCFQACFDRENPSNDENHMIWLMTPASSAEGLNIIEASTVITLTPALNPFRDEQARSRPLRPGQIYVVLRYIFILRGSYEDRAELMRDRKIGNAYGVTEFDRKERKAIPMARQWDENQFARQIGDIFVERNGKRGKDHPNLEQMPSDIGPDDLALEGYDY